MPASPHLPLYGFFEQLRSRGFDLGLESYNLLLAVLADEDWMADITEPLKEKLFRLCITLWYKPNQSFEVFEGLFQQYWEVGMKQLLKEEKTSERTTAEDSPQQPAKPSVAKSEEEEEPTEALKAEEAESEADDLPRIKTPAKADKFIYLQPTTDEEGELNLSSLSTKAQPTSTQSTLATHPPHFLFTGAYQPISGRDLQLSWRYLRTENTEVAGEKLDIPATISTFFSRGLFEPIYQKKKNYHARLMVLIDDGGSMAAFEDFAHEVANMSPLGKFGHWPSVYYFRNVPGRELFYTPAHRKAVSVQDLSLRFQHKKVEMLIISDAGAARGYYDAQRVADTEDSLERLSLLAHRIIWLNPMPQHRWWGSSAEEIAELAACEMFEANTYSFNRAIDVLRGKKNLMF